MIYSLTGTLALVEPYHVVVECAGVGYSVRTSLTTISELPAVGAQVKIFTYLNVREDAVELFGFGTTSELTLFKQLVSVSGVGPKGAMSLLSSLSPDRLALCIAAGDVKSLRAPGIGIKTAERIVLELKDRVSNVSSGAGASASLGAATLGAGNIAEAIGALEVLGYSRADAATVVGKLDPETPVEEIIKYGLKALASGKL